MRREIKIQLLESQVDAVLDLPEGKPRAALTLAHGAGAGMHHWFMELLAARLVAGGLAVLRLLEECPGIPVFASGKSYGGRMSSTAAAEATPPPIQGLISFGYPLHPPKKPSVDRAAHLERVKVPHLILQRDRDKLAELELLEGVCKGLPQVTLHVLKAADHGFDVLKSSGRTREEVMDELVRETLAFVTARS